MEQYSNVLVLGNKTKFSWFGKLIKKIIYLLNTWNLLVEETINLICIRSFNVVLEEKKILLYNFIWYLFWMFLVKNWCLIWKQEQIYSGFNEKYIKNCICINAQNSKTLAFLYCWNEKRDWKIWLVPLLLPLFVFIVIVDYNILCREFYSALTQIFLCYVLNFNLP